MQAFAMDPVAHWHVAVEEERNSLHDGAELLNAARTLARRLPRGGVRLLTRNDESAALVGAALALRPEVAERAVWSPVVLGRDESRETSGSTFFVDAAELGTGLRDAIHAEFPYAELIDGVSLRAVLPEPAAA